MWALSHLLFASFILLISMLGNAIFRLPKVLISPRISFLQRSNHVVSGHRDLLFAFSMQTSARIIYLITDEAFEV